MKNHWLDKKVEREIDDAFAQIDLSLDDNSNSFIDLSTEMNRDGHGTRYKEYERLVVEDKVKAAEKSFLDELEAVCSDANYSIYNILNSTDKEDRDMVKAILLKNMHKTHWIEEVLGSVNYVPHLAPGCDPTISSYAITTEDVGNLTITFGTGIESTVTARDCEIPGGDSITLNDNITIGGFPQDDANSLQQGSAGDANLDIWYGTPFIQNETLQVLADVNTDVTQYQTMHTPVLAGTMTGTIYPTPGNTSYGFTFVVSSDGKFTFDQFVQDTPGNVEYASKQPKLSDEECLQALANGEYDERFMGWYDQPYVEGTTLNLQTGVLELHYHMGHRPEIVVSYEYNLECC